MSRTYRRKKGEKPGDWVTHDMVERFQKTQTQKGVEYTFTHYEYEPLQGEKLKEALAVYHSDGHKYMGSPPKWFVKRFCTRPYRTKEKAELARIIKSGNYDEYSFPENKKSANWMWW